MASADRVGTVGSGSNFWLYSSAAGFDLTHPPDPTSSPVHPRLTLQTTTHNVTLHPPSTALVIVDMQNFFLSPALGRSPTSLGLAAQSKLLEHAIPASHKAGVQIIYLNWGLTDEDLLTMPPATVRGFGWYSHPSTASSTSTPSSEGRLENNSKNPRQYVGLGHSLGKVQEPDSVTGDIDAGRMLFRSTWNASPTAALQAAMKTSTDFPGPPDVILHKNRISGMWGGPENTPCGRFLREHNIRTLLFAGVNTDQCVSGTVTDAFSQGYDCILLRDGSATSSGEAAQKTIEKNCEGTYGFVSTCEWFAEGARKMLEASS